MFSTFGLFRPGFATKTVLICEKRCCNALGRNIDFSLSVDEGDADQPKGRNISGHE